jgi:hypothetical protein
MPLNTYDAFPGRGVELQVTDAINDGTYMFKVLAGIKAANDIGLNGGDYTHTFTVVPTRISDFGPVEPLGSLVYQAHVADTFNGTTGTNPNEIGDVDSFTVKQDGSPDQVVSIQVNSPENVSLTLTHNAYSFTPEEWEDGSVVRCQPAR